MAVDFEQFFQAIAQQESGNNYGAVGVWVDNDRAYGKYQVMGVNIPSWTQQYYGQRLNPQQFLSNPEAQEAVARGKLRDYWEDYGPRGAASAWYSGDPDLHMSTRPQPGGPSIKGYVDSVLDIASGMPVAGSGGSSGSSLDTSAVTVMTVSERAESFGLNLRLINSNSELKRLFDKAVRESWTGERFQASLKNTKWWKTQSSTMREYVTLKYTDPATWRQDRGNAEATIRLMAQKVGARLTADQLADAVYAKLARGWSDARLQAWMGNMLSFQDGIPQGEAAATWGDLHDLAYQLGLTYSTNWFKESTRQIASGRQTLQGKEEIMRRQSAARYSAYAAQIKAGMSVSDLAAPYVEAVSRILELPATDVDVFGNRHVQKAMEGTATTPLWEFENALREDPLWRKTKNAQDAAMGTAHKVLTDFGMAW